MDFYRRKLPHWQPAGAEYFVTFRLAGSLPKEAIVKLRREREILQNKLGSNYIGSGRLPEKRAKIYKNIFKKYDDLLDGSSIGPTWLKREDIAKIVQESVHYRDGKDYELYAYCIMPNHVHLVFKLPDPESMNPEENEDFPVTKLLHSLKSYTALEANKVLKRKGNSFWQSESYDHVIRDADELQNIIYYTLNNPVKAGLVNEWRQWKFSYCKLELLS